MDPKMFDDLAGTVGDSPEMEELRDMLKSFQGETATSLYVSSAVDGFCRVHMPGKNEPWYFLDDTKNILNLISMLDSDRRDPRNTTRDAGFMLHDVKKRELILGHECILQARVGGSGYSGTLKATVKKMTEAIQLHVKVDASWQPKFVDNKWVDTPQVGLAFLVDEKYAPAAARELQRRKVKYAALAAPDWHFAFMIEKNQYRKLNQYKGEPELRIPDPDDEECFIPRRLSIVFEDDHALPMADNALFDATYRKCIS